MTEPVIRAGTSGFSYREWKGNFYPKDLAADGMLGHYASRLPAVEINNTFYKRPDPKVITAWAARVPDTFRFVFKASRYFSAGPGLKNAGQPLADFFGLLAPAKEKLGPLFVQLPQHVKKDVGLLRDFVGAIPSGRRVALELVDPSWRSEDARDVLRAANVAECATDSDGATLDFASTASWGYFRLRRAKYGPRALAEWAARIHEASLDEAYVFFKHEDAGRGPRLAERLMSATSATSKPSR